MWIGTDAGVVRFDGVKFTELNLPVSRTNSPVHITALCEDANGILWIGTQEHGLFEVRGNRIVQFTRDVLLDNSVNSLAADNQGLVWIGTRSGLNLWDGDKFEAFTTRDGLPDEDVTGVNVARSGTVWITTRVGMCRFINRRIVPYAFQTQSQGRSPEYLGAYEDRRGNLWAFGDTYLINLTEGKRFNYFRSSESASVRIWSLCEGWDGRLWIGTSGRGLFCFENNRFEPVVFGNGSERGPYDVRAICEDNENNLWLGTSGGGLIQLRPQSAYILHEEQGLLDGAPTTLASDASGQIYIGLERGGLLAGQSGRFDPLENSDKLGIQNDVSSICVGRDGAVWAGTLGDGLYGLRDGREIHLTTADGLADDAVTAVCSDSAGNIWFSDGSGVVQRLSADGLRRFDTVEEAPAALVTAMIPAKSGGIWIGTKNGDLLREDGGKFTLYPTTTVLDHRAILALYEGAEDRLWIGADGTGLVCLSGGVEKNWSSVNGLPSDVVAGIVQDGDNNLWLATGAGIYRINGSNVVRALAAGSAPLTCELISDAKCVPDSPADSGGTRAIFSPDGELYFATARGILNVDPRDSGTAHYAFPVYIESVSFNRRPPISLLGWDAATAGASNSVPFKAPVDLGSLEFRFTALDYSSPEAIQFRYKLEGNNPDWVDDAGTRSALYGRLPYGHYVFRVQARSPGGTWQDATRAFAFVIPTPLYFQTWVLCLYGVLAVALIAGTVRMVSHRRLRLRLSRLEQQQSLERERMRIARDMHDEIGSKLTKISFLSEHAQVELKPGNPLAGKIDSIAQTSRELLKTMDEIVWVVNPRNDTLENLAAYLAHYAAEYFQNTTVQCELRLPQEVPAYPLSSEMRHNLFLAFEEALNNVLKHSGATQVRVEMVGTPNEFELKVIDNGRGFEAALVTSGPAGSPRGSGGGNGLKNMRQRLAAAGGECMVLSHTDGGTAVVLRIPLGREAGVQK